MKIMCNIVTGAIKDLAKKIGRSESYTCNLVSVWQTQNNSAEYPTAAQLDALLKSNKEQAWDIYLAVPNYEVREYNPTVVPIEHVNGQIYLMRLPKDKPMEHFYNMYKHLPELKSLVVTPEEAYRFILWREMAFMQQGLDKQVKNRPIAEGEAIKKAKEWRKRHPVKVSEVSQPSVDLESQFNTLKSTLSPKLKKEEGRSGWHFITKSSELHNGAPIVHINIYNSASDADTDSYYRLNSEGKVEVASKWASESEDSLKWEVKGSVKYPEIEAFLNSVSSVKSPQQASSVVQTYNGNWTRQDVANDPNTLYIFTDNTDRDSGSGIIPADSWYSKKYGQGHHFPTMTAAVIRGLDNARPISTQRWYHQGAKGPAGRWNDADFDEFKKVIDDEFEEILREWNTGKYKTIMFPQGDGLFNTRISQITMERTPRLYQYLQSKYQNLINLVNGGAASNSLPKLSFEQGQQQSLPGPETKINIYAGTGENADLSNFAKRPFVLTSALAGRLEELVGFPVFADKYYPDEGEEVKNKNTYNSVEQAFQIAKIGFAFDGTNEAIDNLTAEKIEHSIKESTPKEAKRLVGTIPMSKLAVSNWDKFSSQIMKELIKASFEQNPQALQRLLATGNATLTHTQDKGKWGTEFPKLLMEVREELRHESGLTTPQVQPITQQRVAKSFSVEEAAPAPQVVTQEDIENVYKVPEIGLEVLNVDPNNPVARLARDFTAIERHDRVVMLARRFSNIVDQAVNEKIQENADAMTAEMSKDEPNSAELARLYENAHLLNDSVKGRRAVMQEITVQQIFKQMREDIESYLQMTAEELDEDYGEGRGEYMLDAYQRILDNWQALLDEACIIIEGTENVRVITSKHDYHTGTNTTTVVGGTVADSSQDEDTNETEFSDDENGNRADGNGGWSFKVRFVDPRTSLSRGVKRVLSSIKKEGVDGEPEVDDLGNIRYLNSEYAHAALINELSGMIDANDFSVKNEDGTFAFPALEKVAEKYSWANQVISALQAEPSLISSFFADFRKDFIPYWMQYFDEKDGKWKTKALNQAVALDSTKTAIINNYEQGTILDEDSIYEAGRKLSTANAELGVSLSNEILSLLREFDESDYEELTKKVSKGLKMVGLNSNAHVISNLLKSENGIVNLEKVVNAMKNIFSGIEGMPEDAHLIDTFSDDYNTIAQEVGLVSELDNVQSFRAGDKTYYSYSAPNYLDTMFKIFKSDERRDTYLQNQFGKYEWFKKDGKWRSEWLSLIESDEDVRYQMALKELNNISGVEYTDWEPLQIKAAFVREYFSVGYNKGSKKQFAWYNMPIFSDSPVTKFIKFLRYTGDFKGQLTPLFNRLVKQELSRIKLVRDRRVVGVVPIANFDKNGDKFHFFPELNSYNNGTFLQEAMRLTEEKDVKRLNELINNAVTDIMNSNFQTFLKDNFTTDSYELLAESLLADGTITSETQFESALEEYFWNQAYATSQIIQLTTTDLAYYKDGTDFQKRYKEVYAAGTKLNTNSQYGRTIERTVYLADQIVTSSSYHDIKVSLNRAVQAGHIKSFDRDAILNKFKDINVADAQAYRSLSSMRAVLDMMGAWTPEMQQAMDRFDSGQWDMADFNIVWQTIKPFVFTQIEKPDGLGGSIKVPHQNKNSEFLLLAMYQMVANSMGKSPKLRAINRFMEDNGIDVVQFESSVKAGSQGTIDIGYSEPKLQVWLMNNTKKAKALDEAAQKALGDKYSKATDIEKFKAGNDYLLDHDKISQEEYNDRFEAIEPSEQEVYDLLESLSMDRGEFRPEVVHEIPYSDYVIQQPTPEHLFDHIAVFGSQFRNLIISDMPDDPDFRVTVNGKELTKQQVLDLYQAIIVENLLEDWEKVKGKFADIRTLQKAMLDAVKGNPKYGRDMLDALQIVEITNPNTGEKQEVFNIPLDNPSTTNKIQELTTSMFKNAITKQKIKGASCILVSDFGLTKELNIIHREDGSIEGVECYLPAYSKQFYQPFAVTKTDANGNEYQELDVTKMPMELRKIIGYRIPTEDKYSMAPLIIKGFLPQQNGSAIMLPADITQIAGSDFDVDKMFLMIPEFRKVDKYDIKLAWDTFYQENPEITSQIETAQWNAFIDSYNELLETNPALADEIDVDDAEFKDWFVKERNLKNYQWVEGVQDAFSKWFKTNNQRFFKGTEITKVEYDDTKAPQEQSRAARNNMIIDISWGILTHPDTAEKIHNPGNFDKAKIAARIATIISNPSMVEKFANKYRLSIDYVPQLEWVKNFLLEMSEEGKLDELDAFISEYKAERSQLTVDTFIYNHRQNMTGAALIGMYANNTTMQAKFQVTGLAIKDDYVFTINGRTVQSLHDIMSPNGERISKNCANFSAASVDNVKDPVLADLMQNTQTANIAGFMLRAGMSIEEIGVLFSQPAVRDCITETGGLKRLSEYRKAMITALRDAGGGFDDEIQLHDFTSDELMMNALNESRTDWTPEEYNEHLASQIQAVLLMEHITKIAQDLSDLTHISRADSPNGAISISIAGAKNQSQKVNLYTRRSKSRDFTLTGITDIMQNNYVTADMSKDQMREKLLKSKMPMLQTFYSLGIELGNQVMGQYFSQTTPYSDDLVEQLYDNSPVGIVSDRTLNNFYSELVEFALSKTQMLGDDANSTFDEKRDYYLYDFPKEYLAVLAANPGIANMGIFRKMQVKDGNIVMGKSGRLTPMMRETLMRDFDMLLYMDNPAAQKLAIDLFMYSYYKDGFKFGPNSFGTFFSSNFISAFPEFVGALRGLRYNMKSGTYFDNFLPQFYANHWAEGIVPYLSEYADVVETKDGQIAVVAKQVLNRNTLYKGKARSYPFIVYNEVLYALSLDGSDRAIYTPAVTITSSQKGKRGVKYNANMSIQEMASIDTDPTRVEANSKIGANSQLDFDDDLFKSFEEDFAGFGGMEDATTTLEQDYSEADGEAELNEPLCK